MNNPINHPHLTAKERDFISFPSKYLWTNGFLQGEVLDYGCGYGFDTDYLKSHGIDIVGYDNYYRPTYPNKRFDTIICNYVLNVLEPEPQAEVLMEVSELLKPGGIAFFTVRRDLTKEGYRMHYVHKKMTYQCNVVLPYESIFRNEYCEIYKYRHYNQIGKESECPFCNLSKNIALVCETASAVSFYDAFPVNPGHMLIIPKRHVANYFDLSNHEQRSMMLMTNHCKKLLDKRFHPDGYNIGVNINESAGQSVMHAHIHLIPRYNGDVDKPRGGVRGVIPSKQNY